MKWYWLIYFQFDCRFSNLYANISFPIYLLFCSNINSDQSNVKCVSRSSTLMQGRRVDRNIPDISFESKTGYSYEVRSCLDELISFLANSAFYKNPDPPSRFFTIHSAQIHLYLKMSICAFYLFVCSIYCSFSYYIYFLW